MTFTGTEWIIDAVGCRPEALRDGTLLEALCTSVIDDLDLRVVGTPQWHQFPSPGGWTGMHLLTESHLTIHTFPEHGVATLNLYCCRQRERWNWETQLADWLGAADVSVTSVARGAKPTRATIRSRCEESWAVATELALLSNMPAPRMTARTSPHDGGEG